MRSAADEIRTAVLGKHPLIYLHTPEEDRALDILRGLAPTVAPDARVTAWTCVSGLEGADDPATRDPVAAVRRIMAAPRPGFYVMKDLSEFILRPEVTRVLRDAYYELGRTPGAHIVVVSPVLTVPELLEKEVCLVEVPLPEVAELRAHILAIQAQHPQRAIPPELVPEVALSLRGLTLREAGHVLYRVFAAGDMTETAILDHVFAEKRALLKRAGYLEFVARRIAPDDIGGLEVLKEWVQQRRNLFTQEAIDKGLPVPRGVLIMGISGCGKSMCAKAVASLWRVPLFRLDMNLVFSGMFGSPEAAFHKALKAIESIAPAVLWIDEIENALGMTVTAHTAEQQLTFSSFLTWMQERPPLVFVAATANRIESLPAEVIRRGRFDQVFFCDLPTDDERREIIRIHLRRNDVDPDTIEVDRLLHSTQGWNGAEIEQAIVAARIDALQQNRKLNFHDIRRHTVAMVPLSQTMAEQIDAIRSWSFRRATRAGKAPPKSMIPG